MFGQTGIIIPVMLFAGAFIVFMAGYMIGFWICNILWREKEEERKKEQREYAEYLLNPDKQKERTDFNFNGEGKG